MLLMIMRCSYRHSSRRYGIFRKLYTESVGAIKARHELAKRIQEIKKRIIDIADTHGRYKTQYEYSLPNHASRFSRVNNMQYDKRGDALFLEESDLVGIEKTKIELTDLLLKGDARRNIISVVGMGGLGKTTLVKNVYAYASVKSQFSHHAWITVSETFKLEELFKDAITQLFKEENQQLPKELDVMDINRLKSIVNDLLQTKKYIVVFDDVWQLTHWDAIHLAFPRNQYGSRVVITTRNHERGQATSMSELGGEMYVMSPLNNEKAMELFCRKAFPGGACPQHLEQICQKILSACEGLPLAIEVVGSILNTRSQRTEEWELFYKRLGVEMERNSQLEAMTKLLSLSYHDLPLYLKNCLLYLSIFPEDTQIDKVRLTRLWIGEGFVEAIDGMTHEEVAESYLNELIGRCLVQVAKNDHKGSIMAVRVHDIIRHVIILKASEHNITTIFRGQEGKIFQNNIRRLSVHGSISDNFEQAQNICKSIRTIVLCKDVGGHMSDSFLANLLSHGRRLIKVLDFEAAQLERIPDEVFKLFHLKYLNLSNTNVQFIPKSVGMLQSLQTLNLLGTHVRKLPVEIQELRHLQHFLLGRINQEPFLPTFEPVQGVRASGRISNLKSLQQLLHIEADQVDNIRIVTEIGKLLQLRSLRITKLKGEDGQELCCSLGNLRELRKLYIYSVNVEEEIDFEYLKSQDLPRLELLVVVGRLKKFPKLISSLHLLTKIELQYSKLRNDPLEFLHDLPNLITLSLNSTYQGESLRFKAGGFPKLKNLRMFLFQELRWMTVEKDALPLLQLLWMRVFESMEEIPTGIENLMLLQNLEFSNMSIGFVNKLENLYKQSAVYKRLLQIPGVVTGTYNFSHGRWSEVRYLNKETGTFNNVMV